MLVVLHLHRFPVNALAFKLLLLSAQAVDDEEELQALIRVVDKKLLEAIHFKNFEAVNVLQNLPTRKDAKYSKV